MAQAARKSITPRNAAIEIAAALMLPERAVADLPAAKRDPIYQAIARHWLAEEKLGRILADEGTRDTVRFAEKAVNDATATLLRTLPSTAGGLATLLWYTRQNTEIGNSFATDEVSASIEQAALASLRAHGEN